MGAKRVHAQAGESPRPPDKDVEAFLLATYASDPTRWDDSDRFRILRSRNQKLFFCPGLSALRGRASAVARMSTMLAGDIPRLKRGMLSRAISGEPVTLDQLVRCHIVFEAIAAHRDPLVQEVSLVREHGKIRPFQIKENGVVPSYYWVDGRLLSDFLAGFGISTKIAGTLLLGHTEHASRLFDRLIDDATTYRITPYLRDRIYVLLQEIHAQLDPIDPSFRSLPPVDSFFNSSRAVGEELAMGRVRALPIEKGNRVTPDGAEDRGDISRRVRDLAKGAR